MSNKVLAKVNGREITEQDLNFFFQTLGQQVQSQFQGEQGKNRLLDELIYQELFYAEAIDTKLEETEAFQTELLKMKESMLKQFNIKTLVESVYVDEDEISNFYNQNLHYFEGQDQVGASHILVDSETEAQDILQEIKGGLAFADAAVKYSKCPSNQQGGDLGMFSKGQMVPEFEEATFAMAIDEISSPVKTQFGYHIIMKTGEQAGVTQPLEVVKGQINQQLLVQKQNAAYITKVEALKEKYGIEKL
jgi:peptidyl-prolyl cis-trans isomerase C